MTTTMAVPEAPLTYAAARQLLRPFVLGAVGRLVHENGWSETTIGAVAHVAGVSRQTIYNEFGSREQLARAYLLHCVDAVIDNVAAAIESSPDPESGIRAAIESLLAGVDAPVIDMARDLAGGTPLLVKVGQHAVARLATVLGQVLPGAAQTVLDDCADTIVRLVVSYALAPTVSREQAAERLARIAVSML